MTQLTAKPFTARPLTARPFTAYPFGESTSVSNPLVWLAAYPDADGVMQAQLIGSGTPTFNVDAGLLMQTSDGGYIAIAEDTPPWHGARWVDGVAYGTDGSGDPLDPLPSLYGAPSYTNSLTYSNDLTQWSQVGTSVSALDAVGLTGAPNTATTLTDDNGAGYEYIQKNIAVSNNSDTHAIRVFILKDSDETRYPEIQVVLAGGTGQQVRVQINTKTGALVERGSIGTTAIEARDTGVFWELLASVANNSTGNTTASVYIWPAITTAFGSAEVAATGSIIVGNVELHLNKTIAQVRGSAPIITAASTVTTSAISMSYDIANHSDTQGAYYCEWTPFAGGAETTAQTILIDTVGGTEGNILYYEQANDRFISWDRTSTPAVGQTVTSGVSYKAGVAYGDSYSVTEGGDTSSQAPYDGAFSSSSATAIPILGTLSEPSLIRNIRRYNLNYDAAVAKLVELTS